MRKIRQLLRAARALSNEVDVHFRGTSDSNLWVCLIYLGKDVILFESTPDQLDAVVDAALAKLKGMSQQMQAVITPERDSEPEDPNLV